ncbi:PE family protein [Mycobacterium lepromatosis]|uniref:PE family protein n=1 Tax=Mycobacterium lepromatosis TaxID=480418 RepID=UPI0009E5D83F
MRFLNWWRPQRRLCREVGISLSEADAVSSARGVRPAGVDEVSAAIATLFPSVIRLTRRSVLRWSNFTNRFVQAQYRCGAVCQC